MFCKFGILHFCCTLIIFLLMLSFSPYIIFSAEDVCVYTPEPYDLMDSFDRWLPHEAKREVVWDSGVDVPLHDGGYPKVIPFKSGAQEYVVKAVLSGEENVLQDGIYILAFEGKGIVKTGFDAEEKTFSKSGEHEVLVIGSGKGVYVEITKSDIEDPIRNIHLYAPVEKELRSCEFNKSKEMERDNGSDYIVVSESGLLGNETYMEPSDSKWKNKIVTGLIIFFAILAVIYILK